MGIGLLILASVFFLCVSLALFVMHGSEKEKRVSLEERLDSVLAANKELEKDLDEITLMNKGLESKLSSSRQQLKSLSESHSKEKESRQLLMSDLEREKESVQRLMNEITSEKEGKEGLVEKLAQAEGDYERLKNQLAMIMKAKETLERKVKEIISKKGVELDRIVVQQGAPSEFAPEEISSMREGSGFFEEESFEDTGADGFQGGEVLIVNKKFGFAIVNMGKYDGLGLGDLLGVYRKDKFLAEAQVEKLYDRMSAATLLPQYKKITLKPGDQVSVSR